MAWYVVHVGKKPGVYSSWEEAHEQVNGFKGNCYKKYNTRNQAVQAFYGHSLDNPPLLQPVNPPHVYNDGNDGSLALWLAVFKIVIVLVVVLLIGFLIWKLL